MAKQITITYNDNQYTLEFTRDTVQKLDRAGIVAQDIATKPMSVLPALFRGAFLAHHKNIKAETVDDIYAHMPNKEKLIELLVSMYNEPIETLFDEPEESEKNAQWEASW